MARTAEDAGTARFGAEPAALGEAVGCATVSGRAATLAVAAPGVELTRVDVLPADPAELAGVLAGCPLALVSLDQLTDAGVPGVEQTDDGTDPEPRAAALAAHRRRRSASCGPRSTAMPGETLLLLQGISEVNDGRPQLHVGMAVGPRLRHPAGSPRRAPAGRPTPSSSTSRRPRCAALGLEPRRRR